MNKTKGFFEATAILIGTIIGSGIFAIPYVIMKAGLLIGVFYFILLGLMILTMHLVYGEIVLRTSSTHRIVGYGEKYLGKSGRNILFVAALVNLLMSNLVYLILGGNFLSSIFGDIGNNLFYVFLFWALLSLGVIYDWKKVSFLDLIMTVSLLLAIVIVAVFGFMHFRA
ncbi:MAG: aromatic amino acid transport family protein, partial [Patescibacteria group bacterium]|nr:aromatic amino acid transport family protein [Patescibacteria group bacterium]